MSTVATPVENGRKILEIYQHFDSRPGQVLRTNTFLAVGMRRRLQTSDLQQGLEFAVDQGWVENTGRGFRLTACGFAAM